MDVRRGQTVYGSDGTKLGRVLQCDESGFVVENGIVFATDVRVRYDDVATAGAAGVRLRIRADALLSEEVTERWDPASDPEGAVAGVDIEPLQGGMAEIEAKQHRARLDPTLAGEGGLHQPARLRREASAATVRLHRAPTPERGAREPSGAGATWGTGDAELAERIEQEIDDLERGGGCAARGPEPIAEAPAGAGGAAPREQPPVSAARRTRARSAHSRARGAVARSASKHEAPRPGEGPRLDFRRAAPGAIAAMRRLETYVRQSGLEAQLLELVRLRASQLNGCAYCIDMHTKEARRAGETEQRLYTLAAWKETPLFTARERAALAWTEAVTQVGVDRVEEDTYLVVREQFGERELVDLTMAVIAINGWNRLAIAFRSVPGSYQPGPG